MKLLYTLIILYTFLFSQNMEVYDTNQFGVKNLTPSIIIDEDSNSGNYKVYSVNQFGIKNISPDEIIENNKYTGTWNVYRVSNWGIKDAIPTQVAETSSLDNNAILILTEDGQKLGYVPQEINEVLSKLMDAGKLLFGRLDEKNWVDDWLKLDIQVYLRDL